MSIAGEIAHENILLITVVRARHLPRTCTVGPLKSIHYRVGCVNGRELHSKASSLSNGQDSAEGLVAFWNQKFRFNFGKNASQRYQIKLFGSGSSSAEPALQLITLLGNVIIGIEPEKSNPFGVLDGTYHSSKQLCTNGTCTSHNMESWFPVQSDFSSKIEILIRLSLLCTLRDTNFAPSPRFMTACAVPAAQRTGLDVSCMASELRFSPAAIQISRPLLTVLMEHAELRNWQKGDIAEPMPRHPRESSLHFVIAGRFTLFSGGDMPVPHVRLGKQHGWRGPGEALGDGALLAHGGTAAGASCESATAQTLRVDRRICEEIMEPIRRLEAVFSADVQVCPPRKRYSPCPSAECSTSFANIRCAKKFTQCQTGL